MDEGEDNDPVGAKQQCPCDDPSSSFQLYSDGHGYCFAGGCPHPRWSPKMLSEKGWEIDPDLVTSSSGPHRTRIEMDEDLKEILDSSSVRALTKRKITQATCEHWDYRTRVDSKGHPQHVAVYRVGGQIVAAKVRIEVPEKDFFAVGTLPHFYGQDLLKKGGAKLIIVGGEVDTLTVSQLWKDRFPVVSPAKGEKHLAKAVAACLEDINKFKEVVFCLDMDEVGRARNIEAAKLLPPGKAKIADLPRKDPNEMLMHGEADKLISCLMTAAEYRPDGIVSARELVAKAKNALGWGLRTGIDFIDNLQWGWRDGELVILGSGIGMGKSDLSAQVAAHLTNTGTPCAVFNYEASPVRTLRGVAGKWVERRLSTPLDAGLWVQEDEDRAFSLPGIDLLYINDHYGAISWAAVMERTRYLAHAHGVKRVFVDPMLALVAGAEDERKALDVMLLQAASLGEELGVGFWFNSHLTRPEGKSHEEGGKVSHKNFRGSGGITIPAALVLGLERDQQAEDEQDRNTTTLRAIKVREAGENTGRTACFCYNTLTGMLEPKEYQLLAPGDEPATPPELKDFAGG